MADRIVCWFSCGAASAVATKMAIEQNAKKENPLPLEVVRCYVAEEHPDNDRFAEDCEKWFGVPVRVLKNEKYDGSIYKVFEKRKYIVGVGGAPCTTHLKKEIRKGFQQFGDLQVFGYTVEEQDRLDRFIDSNNDAQVWPVLIDFNLTHDDCLAIVARAGIELPAMYKLGYKNNNCVGCVKGGAGYWNKIRNDFPEMFDRMSKMERHLGVSILKVKGKRIYLDQLDTNSGHYPSEKEVQCGIMCEVAEREIAGVTNDP